MTEIAVHLDTTSLAVAVVIGVLTYFFFKSGKSLFFRKTIPRSASKQFLKPDPQMVSSRSAPELSSSGYLASHVPADVEREKLIITVALTGNVPTKKMNPAVPVTPQEIADDVHRCAEAGASLFHVHARDANEKPTHDLNVFREICRNIKAQDPDVVIQLSTGARAGSDPSDRWNVIRLLPEMGSFATGSNNLAKMIYSNPPDFLMKLGTVFKETGVVPEIECFEAGHIQNALHLVNKGILSVPLHFNFVLNTAGGLGGTVKNLQHMADSIPPGCTWCVSGVGKRQLPLAAAAIAMGGHVRIGLEDNIFYTNGEPASNIGLVQKIVALANELGREIATPDEVRRILTLPPENKDRILNYLEDNSPLADVSIE
eukprot:GCRY01000221.1.p1 GENE.GCRY01000221.1~~GCRY01000221.1.p1  ORF type:complete len:372 (-),score=97.90 GCRY01000221.1:161-1276(-)